VARQRHVRRHCCDEVSCTVRNPMYFAITAVIFGEGLLLGNAKLLGYGVCVWLAFFVFVLAYEEPTLRRTYPLRADRWGCA
jgi:protein-S-isoprenylcysteine O-methyltransferase Ste14